MASRSDHVSWLHRRFSRRTGLRTGTLAVAGAGAWLVACGGDDDNQGSGSRTSGAGSSNQITAPTGEPKRGGVMSYRVIGTPPLDPHTNTSFRAQVQAGHTYSRMLKFKTGIDPAVSYNYEVEPDLAASHELTDDGTRLIFTLQPNATFHNKPPVNGRAVTSEDVALSLERFRNANANANRFAFGSPQSPIVAALETPDPRTVVVRLAKPYAPILNLFANPQYLWIMPREVSGGFDPARDQIGSGPWVFDQLQPDIEVRMSRNPNWFIQNRPHLDGIRAVIIPEVAQELAQFQAETLDYAVVPTENRPDIENSLPRAQWISYTPTTYTFISPQQREGSPFRDERVRRALSMAIDRDAWSDLLYLSQGVKYLNAIPASMGKWWLDPQGDNAGEGANYFTFNGREARQLLRAAGADNLSVRFLYANNAYGERFNQGAEAIAGMLNQNGFRTTITPQDYAREWIASGGTFLGNYEGAFYGLQTPFTDPHDYLFNMHGANSPRNHAGINDPQLDQMLAQEERTLNEADRVKVVHDIQRYLMTKVYYIPIAVGDTNVAVQPWLKNYQYSSTYGYPTENFTGMWIDRG